MNMTSFTLHICDFYPSCINQVFAGFLRKFYEFKIDQMTIRQSLGPMFRTVPSSMYHVTNNIDI